MQYIATTSIPVVIFLILGASTQALVPNAFTQFGMSLHVAKREIPSHTSKPVEDGGLLKKTQQVFEQVRGLYVRHGFDFEPFGIGDAIKLTNMTTGGGMEWADVELFLKLRDIQSPSSIYGIGNAFGFSTLVLASIFEKASIDIIDAGIEGKDNVAGIDLTNQIALEESLNVKVYKGFSPQDVPASMRSGIYQLAFIDGKHTPGNLRHDFAAILPHMATKCIIVCHDIGLVPALTELVKKELMLDNPDFNFAQYNGTNFKNILGTGLFYRGFTGVDMTHLENLGSPFPFVPM